ncbi:hypothetical protein Tco_1522141, partial [Tanacetum coccineum]
MGIVMELHNGACYWPTTREVRGDDEAEEAAEEETGWSANASGILAREIGRHTK